MNVDSLFICTPIVGVCNCSMFCCTLLYVHSSFAVILMGKRELVALLFCTLTYFACFVLLESSDCCVALPRCSMGLSAVCDCGISLSYSLTILAATPENKKVQFIVLDTRTKKG